MKGPYAVGGHLAYCVEAKKIFKDNDVINIINLYESYLHLLDPTDKSVYDTDLFDYDCFKMMQVQCLS